MDNESLRLKRFNTLQAISKIMNNHQTRNRIAYASFLLLIVFTGYYIENSYYIQVLTFIGINTLLALGLNMLMGYAGQLSLGHAAFYGIGAYGTAILTVQYNLSPWLALPAAIAAAMIVAYIVGIPTLKLSGYYLGMGTLGFGMIVNILFREWSSVTGGSSGFIGIPTLELGPVSFASGRNYFFLVWGFVLTSFIVCQRIIDSRIGLRNFPVVNDRG